MGKPNTEKINRWAAELTAAADALSAQFIPSRYRCVLLEVLNHISLRGQRSNPPTRSSIAQHTGLHIDRVNRAVAKLLSEKKIHEKQHPYDDRAKTLDLTPALKRKKQAWAQQLYHQAQAAQKHLK